MSQRGLERRRRGSAMCGSVLACAAVAVLTIQLGPRAVAAGGNQGKFSSICFDEAAKGAGRMRAESPSEAECSPRGQASRERLRLVSYPRARWEAGRIRSDAQDGRAPPYRESPRGRLAADTRESPGDRGRHSAGRVPVHQLRGGRRVDDTHDGPHARWPVRTRASDRRPRPNLRRAESGRGPLCPDRRVRRDRARRPPAPRKTSTS